MSRLLSIYADEGEMTSSSAEYLEGGRRKVGVREWTMSPCSFVEKYLEYST